MKNILWNPSEPNNTQMANFMHHVNQVYDLKMNTYDELFNWSINHIEKFWGQLWEYTEIIHSSSYSKVVDDVTKMPGAKWFSGAKLNFSENLLRYKDNEKAIIFKSEGQSVRFMTYSELFYEVEKLAHSLRKLGIQKGDRIAGYMPNIPESIIAMLATVSIGAIWSASSPDFGMKGVLDRFSQIKPRIIFSSDGYYYNGQKVNTLEKLNSILNNLPSVEKVIIIEYLESKFNINNIGKAVLYKDFVDHHPQPLLFDQLPFDHPLYILYSSGTTGLPKSIVHGAGGTLIQHLKELYLHSDLTRADTIFYFTTCGWMMWNWLVSSLAVGATVVLYDGSPFYPDKNTMWDMVDELGITVFGTSAKFIDACKDENLRPGKNSDLTKLRAILSTGSPLVDENFDYIYQHVKDDIMLGSISGGTDIISCFATANPMLPVYRGELQCRGLAMDIHAYSPKGQSVINQKGELVCKSPFPSMPIYFWNDENGSKYRKAYFDYYPGVWYHGDFIELNEYGGIRIFGRSDATLNPGGIRIGTAEIYRVVDSFSEIEDSLVIGQEWNGDQRVILFLKPKNQVHLSDDLLIKIKTAIRSNCSPRHVPKIILSIEDIPYTINGKKVEIAVKKIIQGENITNLDALKNPESLKYFKNIPELLL